MTKIEGVCLDVLNETEFVAIVTQGTEGPHMVGNWGDYVRKIGVRGDRIVMPAGGYRQTEENLRLNPKVTLLVASRKVKGSRSPGQGLEISGVGEIVAEGPLVDEVRALFPWARGAFVVRVVSARTQL